MALGNTAVGNTGLGITALARRGFLSSALALAAAPLTTAFAAPSAAAAAQGLVESPAQSSAQGTAQQGTAQAPLSGAVSRVEYKGADEPAAFAKFVQRESANNVAVVVFHAQWCGPCKQFFHDVAALGAQPGQKFKVIGVDVGPPDFKSGPYKNLVGAHQVFGTPSLQFYLDGDRQYGRVGLCQNKEELGRYLRDLQRGLKGTGPAQIHAPRCEV